MVLKRLAMVRKGDTPYVLELKLLRHWIDWGAKPGQAWLTKGTPFSCNSPNGGVAQMAGAPNEASRYDLHGSVIQLQERSFVHKILRCCN